MAGNSRNCETVCLSFLEAPEGPSTINRHSPVKGIIKILFSWKSANKLRAHVTRALNCNGNGVRLLLTALPLQGLLALSTLHLNNKIIEY